MKFAFAALLLTFVVCFSNARATSIVILRSADRIYIGADSRRSYHETGESYAGFVCKIVPAGRLFFVASGLTYANNQQVADIAAQVGSNSFTVRDAIEQFRARMQDFLPRAIATEGRVEKARKGLILEAAFVGIERNLAWVSIEWYRTNGNAKRPHITTDRRTYSSRTPGHYDFIFLGKTQAIDRYVGGRSLPVRNDASAVALITRLINLEISESPQTTAAPIDILELDGGGPHWLQQKASCRASPLYGR